MALIVWVIPPRNLDWLPLPQQMRKERERSSVCREVPCHRYGGRKLLVTQPKISDRFSQLIGLALEIISTEHYSAGHCRRPDDPVIG